MGRKQIKANNHYVRSLGHNLPHRVYRSSGLNEVRDTELACCRYLEHAELIVKALNQYVP
jgi:hypothetical protein